MEAPLFDAAHIAQGERLYNHLMKMLTSEDPRPSLIALGLALTRAAASCQISRARLVEMLQIMDANMQFNGGDPARTASSLIALP